MSSSSVPNRQLAVINPPCSFWTLGGFPPEGFFSMEGSRPILLDDINVYRIGGAGAGLYVEWDLSVIDKSKDRSAPWAAWGADTSIRDYFSANPAMFDTSPRSVYAEASGGGPQGRYLGQIVTDRRRLQGLFAQAFGHRNANPCRCCERRYLQRFAPLVDEAEVGKTGGLIRPIVNLSQEDDRVHVMLPWFECISLPEYAGDACGNCLYMIEANKCDYAKPEYQDRPEVTAMKGRRALSVSLGPRRLEACPRMSDDLKGEIDMNAIRREQSEFKESVAQRARNARGLT